MINYNQSNATSVRLTSAKFRNSNQTVANGVIKSISLPQDQQENVARLRAASYIGDEKYPFTLHDGKYLVLYLQQSAYLDKVNNDTLLLENDQQSRLKLDD